jgi:hypothetical protein
VGSHGDILGWQEILNIWEHRGDPKRSHKETKPIFTTLSHLLNGWLQCFPFLFIASLYLFSHTKDQIFQTLSNLNRTFICKMVLHCCNQCRYMFQCRGKKKSKPKWWCACMHQGIVGKKLVYWCCSRCEQHAYD